MTISTKDREMVNKMLDGAVDFGFAIVTEKGNRLMFSTDNTTGELKKACADLHKQVPATAKRGRKS